jgi:hypothetical protein
MIPKSILRKTVWLALLEVVTIGMGSSSAEDPVLLMPMFSIEAFEVNSVPIQNGPTSKITVAPGDVITAKILIRNWSPQGQKLRAYQAKLDPAGFKSGTAGVVLPVGHNPGTNNDANAFIDLKDPTFVHKELPSIPLVDSASEGYRWLNVLLELEQSPLSAQDGKKYYCGTAKLQPSADAEGTFKISLMEEGGASGLLDPANEPIIPIGYDPLLIEVKFGVRWLKIESSDPPNGAVDGRILLSSAGKHDPVWSTVMLQFNADVGDATAADFEVQDGSKTPPKITRVETSGSQVLITLDQGIRTGSWTTIKHKGSGSVTRIGRLSGDVSNDGRTDSDDLMVLIRGLNGATSLPLYRGDLDADGNVGARDALQMIDLLTQKRTANQSRLR